MFGRLQKLSEFTDELLQFFGKSNNEFKTRPEILLTGERPLPLQGVNPRSIEGTKWWNETRAKVYASNDYHCLACGSYHEHDGKRFVSDPLHAHELYEVDYSICTMKFVEIVPLCEYCHAYIHQKGMSLRFDKGINDEQFCWEVLTHGFNVFCKKLSQNDSTFQESWSDWRFIYNGKEYKSNYKSYEEWEEKEKR